mgnify:FL=1
MLPFLPALMGMGLKAAGLTALKAGLITGLGTALVTKDIGKGLTAGLGAYGGAGLGEAAGTAGQAATAADAMTLGPATTTGLQVAPNIGEQAAAQFANLDASGKFSSMGDGLSALTSGGQAGANALQAAGGGGNLAMSGLTALTPTLEQDMNMDQLGSPPMMRPSSYNPETGMFTDLPPYLARNGGVVPGLNSQIKMQAGGMPMNAPMAQQSIYDPSFLGSMGNANLVSGSGDGMSDSVAGNIDGGQDVRLSVDEFVVPADVVSGLGNGSTTAGAKKLYGMMDNVRDQRTGRTRQAPEVDAARLMPA